MRADLCDRKYTALCITHRQIVDILKVTPNTSPRSTSSCVNMKRDPSMRRLVLETTPLRQPINTHR